MVCRVFCVDDVMLVVVGFAVEVVVSLVRMVDCWVSERRVGLISERSVVGVFDDVLRGAAAAVGWNVVVSDGRAAKKVSQFARSSRNLRSWDNQYMMKIEVK